MSQDVQARPDNLGSNGTQTLPDSAYRPYAIRNQSPLLTIALALFGPGSFIAERAAQPSVQNGTAESPETVNSCTERVPFLSLLSTAETQLNTVNAWSMNPLTQCVTGSQRHLNDLQEDLLAYVQAFIGPVSYGPGVSVLQSVYDERLKNAFEAAAFLANEQWLTTAATQVTLAVSYDAGNPTQVPNISEAGIVIVSLLLAIYLIGLLATATYSSWNPRWTSHLDSLAMMQLGAAISDRLPLRVVADSHLMKTLDETPGWVGDGGCDEGAVGELRLGARSQLRAKRRYACYEHDL